jgi:hypothetical protein
MALGLFIVLTASVIGTVAVAGRDGYRRVPTRR